MFTRPLITVAMATLIAVGVALVWVSRGKATPAPAVTYTLLDGRTVSLDQLRGKVVLVNFWATTCASCLKKMPQLAATHERFAARGFETLAVAMQYDSKEAVEHFAQSRQLPFGVTIDTQGTLASGFGDVRLTPTTFVLNRRGEIVRRYTGEPDFSRLHALIERLLKVN